MPPMSTRPSSSRVVKRMASTWLGRTRDNASWQTKVDGAYDIDQFAIDWDHQQVQCPQGKWASAWRERHDASGRVSIVVQFRQGDCQACEVRALYTRAKKARYLRLHPREQHEALEAARARFSSDAGKEIYKRRAGIEGRSLAGGTGVWPAPHAILRHRQNALTTCRDRHGHQCGSAGWRGSPGRRALTTRTSRFAALAPTPAMGPG